jgi:hypothetical protein
MLEHDGNHTPKFIGYVSFFFFFFWMWIYLVTSRVLTTLKWDQILFVGKKYIKQLSSSVCVVHTEGKEKKNMQQKKKKK